MCEADKNSSVMLAHHEPNTEQRSPLLQTMSVNVRLCGSIPRTDMKDIRGAGGGNNNNGEAPCSLKACLTSPPLWGHRNNQGDARKMAICDALNGLAAKRGSVPCKQQLPLGPVLEPPSWAVPAKGETFLEPVCEAAGRHSSIDLTTRACFRVGRSPHSDIPLMHATSSRRHAMLFHHSNGSCYVVDCGSAHGTYVNGARIPSPSNGGLVIPHKVKRGALVRFGGPGAPCFLLKSFSEEESLSSSMSSDMGELVRRNTRLNAMGKYDDQEHVQHHQLQLHDHANVFSRDSVCSTIEQALVVSRKRSFDSLDESLPSFTEGCDAAEPCSKRLRCSSPPLVESPPLRLVSPELPVSIKKCVSFSTAPPQLFKYSKDSSIMSD